MKSPSFRRALLGSVALAAGAVVVLPPAGHAPALAASPASPKAASAPGEDTTAPAGVDLGKLDDFERKVFFRVIDREASACGRGHSLLHSAKHDPSCRASFYAVRYVARLVDSGFTDSEIAERLDRRFRAPRVPRFDLARAPAKGKEGARVTVVEFVDYECPHCLHAQSVLQQLVDAYPNEVRVYFKHFPLSGNTHARQAAESAVAAHQQGKFWPFNDQLWLASHSLTPAAIEKAAKTVGLDVALWRKAAASDAVKARVEADKAEGRERGITGTPAIYLNGRRYADPLDLASLRDWVDEELGR